MIIYLYHQYLYQSLNILMSSYSKLITFIQSRILVYRIYNFEIYSFVIKIVIDVSRAELLAIGIPILGLTIENVEDTLVELDPIKIS